LAHVPTDLEKYLALASRHPGIGADASVSIPHSIFKCINEEGHDICHLLAMREATGQRMADILATYAASGQVDASYHVFEKFGRFLRNFHTVYQMQHGDCHPSNVYYDESRNTFTMIDAAAMGTDPYAGTDDDVSYFNKGLLSLSQYYGRDALKVLAKTLNAAYKYAADSSSGSVNANGKSAAATATPPKQPASAPDVVRIVEVVNGLKMAALRITAGTFDPASSEIKPQIIACLGCSPSALIEEMDNPGGRNEGLWLLSDSTGNIKYVMKLIPSARKHPDVPTDTEKCVALATRSADIGRDDSLSFPTMILKICLPNGNEVYDLHIMRQATGLRIADIIAYKYYYGEIDQLMEVFRRLGMFLSDFHKHYQMQHGDCHPSNVFYDEEVNLFTLIDVADIAPSPYGPGEDDVTYFRTGMLTLAEYYTTELLNQCAECLRDGYVERDKSSRGPRGEAKTEARGAEDIHAQRTKPESQRPQPAPVRPVRPVPVQIKQDASVPVASPGHTTEASAPQVAPQVAPEVAPTWASAPEVAPEVAPPSVASPGHVAEHVPASVNAPQVPASAPAETNANAHVTPRGFQQNSYERAAPQNNSPAHSSSPPAKAAMVAGGRLRV